MSLTAAEVELGWVEFCCDAHGFLVAMGPRVTAWCRCGKRARALRHGRLLDPDTLKPTKAKARALNAAGHPFCHACGDCGADFQGRTLLRVHRVGRGGSKRCLSEEEMTARDWRQDGRGRWREQRNNERLRELNAAA